jgi:hypothetical protein
MLFFCFQVALTVNGVIDQFLPEITRSITGPARKASFSSLSLTEYKYEYNFVSFLPDTTA